MKKYKVKFEKVETGYVEVFADNKEDAIKRLYKQKPLNGMYVIETGDVTFCNPETITQK